MIFKFTKTTMVCTRKQPVKSMLSNMLAPAAVYRDTLKASKERAMMRRLYQVA